MTTTLRFTLLAATALLTTACQPDHTPLPAAEAARQPQPPLPPPSVPSAPASTPPSFPPASGPASSPPSDPTK